MKNDLRVRYTQKVIQEAFWKLLKEKPLAKITVKEVCDLAGINRGTFYKHYMDPYDLMDKIQEEMVCQMEQRLASIEPHRSSTPGGTRRSSRRRCKKCGFPRRG